MQSYRAKITSKGQITIPKPLRDKYHLREGELAALIPTDEGVVLRHEDEPLKELRGLLRKEVDVKRASRFIRSLRKEWRLE
jgi:AbrB family looped-hinge helix DNA binding protein